MKLRNKKTGEIKDICEVLDMKKKDGVLYKYSSLDQLNAEWEDASKEKLKEFWYIKPNGCVERDNLGAIECDIPKEYYDKMVDIGNYFETEEEAKKAVEKLKAWKRLREKNFEFAGYDLYSGSGAKDKTEGEFAISAVCSDFVDNKDLDLLFRGEE